MVDATMMPASGSTTNQAPVRAPELASTQKGRNWDVGLKAHRGSDRQGRGHRVVGTHAAVHDSQLLADCCPGAEQGLDGDKASARAAGQPAAEARGRRGGFIAKRRAGGA